MIQISFHPNTISNFSSPIKVCSVSKQSCAGESFSAERVKSKCSSQKSTIHAFKNHRSFVSLKNKKGEGRKNCEEAHGNL